MVDLYVAFMAGSVLALFLMVGEIAAIAKYAPAIFGRLRRFYRLKKIVRLLVEFSAMALFFLLQPVIIGLLVVMALDKLIPGFSAHVVRQLRQVFAAFGG